MNEKAIENIDKAIVELTHALGTTEPIADELVTRLARAIAHLAYTREILKGTAQ